MAEEQMAAVERALITRIGNLESLVAAIDTRFREITLELASSRDNMSGLVTQLQEKLAEQDTKYAEISVTVAELNARRAPSSPTTPQQGYVDTRVLGKPSIFTGKPEQWRDWSFNFKSYCAAVNDAITNAMDEYGKLTEGVLRVALEEDMKKITVQLSYMLILSCKDAATEKIRNSGDPQHGLEIWRLFLIEYEPASRSRHGGMLVGILASKFRGTGIDELDKWEGAIKVYQDSSGEQVSDAIRIATVMNNLQEGPLLSHLQLNSDRYEKYGEFKSVIENYYRSKKAWTAQGTPMEVDALQNGPNGTAAQHRYPVPG